MDGKKYINIAIVQIIVLFLSANTYAADYWQAPFDTVNADTKLNNTRITLDDAISLVAVHNPLFKSIEYQNRAALSNVRQAGVWANPELDAEFEEVGLDSPGFDESEFTVSIAQDFELFGQRGARKNLARVNFDYTKLQSKLSSFDLYLELKSRYYTFAHAQLGVGLSEQSLGLAQEIVENIQYRLEKGAALQSELLLAQLDEQRAKLALDQAKLDVVANEAALTALWNQEPNGIEVSIGIEPDFKLLSDKIDQLTHQIDSTRAVIQMSNELNILGAEKSMAIKEARPTVTLSGGVKRLASDKSKSFLFGFSLPLPIFDRNQGTRDSYSAQIQSLRYDIERNRIETDADIRSHIIQLNKSIERHTAIDSMLLPTAEQVYQILQDAYEAGRVPYTQLLEAKRSYNELNFEHNDMILAIQEQIIALESLIGVTLPFEKEN